MLVRDILPPEKVKRIAREEVLGMKPYKNKRSRYLNLILRALIATFLIITALFYAPSQVWGENEEFVQLAKEEIAEVINLDSGIFEALGLETEQEPVADENEAVATNAVKDYGDKLKLQRKDKDGRDKFAMESLGGDKVEFSDSDETSADPYLDMSRWGGEASLRIKIPHAAAGDKSLHDNRLNIKSGGYEVEVYPRAPEEITEEIAGAVRTFLINEEGGVEFDIVLAALPSSNVFEFPVESEGLDFIYQAPLNPEHPTWTDRDEDGVADAFLPEIAVGSYAVYRSGQKNIVKSEEDAARYKTGKAFHIYRPRITDAGGQQVWGELHLDEGKSVLTVTVPEPWLATASYPVRIDPNIGYTAIGGGTAAVGAAAIVSTTPVAGSSGVVTSITAYARQSVAGSMKGNIYDSGFNPVAATGTAAAAVPVAAAWTQLSYATPVAIAAGNNYYVSLWIQSDTTIYADFDAGAPAVAAGSGAWGAAWPTLSSMPHMLYYSIYATYAENKSSPAGVGISGGGMLMF